MNKVAEDILMHYGVKRRSGRYPWGSGDTPYQRSGDFLSRIEELERQGIKGKELADSLGMSTSDLRLYKQIAKTERRSLMYDTASSLRADGYSYQEIAEKMGFKNDSSVRSLLNEGSKERMNKAQQTADILKQRIEEKGMIDVGAGAEKYLGVSKEKLNEAVTIMEAEGYPVYGIGVSQVTNKNQQTNVKVLCPKDTEYAFVYNNLDKIHPVKDYDLDSIEVGETSLHGFKYPASMDSKRLAIRYAEDGGTNLDGVIELRPGVKDLDLGNSHYSQVRIMVDDTKYLKGMAIYSDNLPDGVDVLFNTNKSKSVSKMDVLKDIKDDPDNPFGALLREKGGQYEYLDSDGNKKLGLINKTRQEGDWNEWDNKVPSQFLSKQNLSLVKKQLDLTTKDKLAEYDTICSLTNPTLKKKLLKSFADDCDASAVHLKAAAFPRQRYQVILPVTTLKDTEVYAPNYKNGEKVALIRYPHGGTFEIPILTVNNKHADSRKILGTNPIDAIGINSKVAERLSGADFDGDFVMVIPTGKGVKITSKPPLKDLEGFDPKSAYGGEVKKDSSGKEHYYQNGIEYKRMSKGSVGKEMGVISNLITDMTLKGAPDPEIARAVKHSMVVIDAYKHKLNYKQSYKDNNIKALQEKYQGTIDPKTGRYHEGAGTLISRAKSQQSVNKRRGQPWINPETGAKEWERVNSKTGKYESKYDMETYTDKNGKLKYRTQQSTKMAETPDARTLSSGHPIEEAYATYANSMKSLGNQARKEMLATKDISYSASSKKIYQKEVSSLDAKLRVSEMNAPKERQAQLIANSTVKAKIQSNPELKNDKKEIKKLSQRSLAQARIQVGAKRTPIELTDKEWEAIQAGAISHTKLEKIFDHVDSDKLKERAMPRQTTQLSQAQINKIKAMANAGYSNEEIAKSIGKSSSTVLKYIKS